MTTITERITETKSNGLKVRVPLVETDVGEFAPDPSCLPREAVTHIDIARRDGYSDLNYNTGTVDVWVNKQRTPKWVLDDLESLVEDAGSPVEGLAETDAGTDGAGNRVLVDVVDERPVVWLESVEEPP